MAKANIELRRLMQLKKAGSHKVNHPLAKYNNLEQLVCVICTKVVKDDSLWNAHLQSKKHKENVLLIKTKKSNTSSPAASSSSQSSKYNSKLSSTNSKTFQVPKIPNNVGKQKLPVDFFDQNNRAVLDKPVSVKSSLPLKLNEEVLNKPKSILKNSSSCQPQTDMTSKDMKSDTSPLPHVNDNTNGMEEENVKSSSRKRKADSSLPTDFFDEPMEDMESSVESAVTSEPKKDTDLAAHKKTENTGETSAIPEGFFDDPKKDAVARNVEYKDPKETEWELFQKVIQEETKVSEAIQEEEDEESEMHKDLTELNKMKSCLSRVENLKNLINKDKQKKLEVKRERQGVENEDSNSEESDEDIGSIFDWRAKVA